jgi:hypothetical protein
LFTVRSNGVLGGLFMVYNKEWIHTEM